MSLGEPWGEPVTGTPSLAQVLYRLEQVEHRQKEAEERNDERDRALQKHEQELYGDRGVNSTLRDLALQMKWLQRALWGLAASVTVAAVIFAAGAYAPN
jgi:hypothetical protein